jgi:hypothetical protein
MRGVASLPPQMGTALGYRTLEDLIPRPPVSDGYKLVLAAEPNGYYEAKNSWPDHGHTLLFAEFFDSISHKRTAPAQQASASEKLRRNLATNTSSPKFSPELASFPE